jgi:rhamnose transport system ATP-binding protein
MAQPILELRGISKSFPGVKALEDARLELFAGEVTALVGENGAGKSTLVKVVTGIYQPDSGAIRLNGEKVVLPTPQAAFRAGITAIHQKLCSSMNSAWRRTSFSATSLVAPAA